MTRDVAGAAVLGVVAGLVAAAAWVLPALAGIDLVSRAGAWCGACVVIALPWRVVRLLAANGQRPAPGRALRIAVFATLVAALVVGGGLYGLYRWARPTLLAERFAQQFDAVDRAAIGGTARAAELTAGRARALDPLNNAAEAAALLAIGGAAVALFLAYGRR